MNTGTPSDTPRVTPVTGGPPCVGLREAARVSGVSIATVRRRREQLIEHGATVQASGWMIPIPALVAVGLLDRVSPPVTGSRTKGDTSHATPVMAPGVTHSATPSSEVEELRRELVEARQRAAVAEAVAAERQVTIEAQALALRAITARPTTTNNDPPEEPATPTTPVPSADRSTPQPRPEVSTPGPAPAAEPQGWRSWFRRRHY